MFTSKPPTCAGRTLALPRKDRDIRYLRPLGNSDIAKFFDEIASTWGERAYDEEHLHSKYPSSKVRHEIAISELTKRDKAGLALDMGCGTGELAISLARLGFKVTAFNISPEMIRLAKEKAAGDSSLKDLKNSIAFSTSDVQSFTSSETFDVISAMGFTAYLDDDLSFFTKARSMLKDDGILIVDFRNKLTAVLNGTGFRR